VSRDERFATMKGSDCPIDHATLKKISLKTSILVRQFSKLDFVRFGYVQFQKMLLFAMWLRA
jgi:hypothetical protein